MLTSLKEQLYNGLQDIYGPLRVAKLGGHTVGSYAVFVRNSEPIDIASMADTTIRVIQPALRSAAERL